MSEDNEPHTLEWIPLFVLDDKGEPELIFEECECIEVTI